MIFISGHESNQEALAESVSKVHDLKKTSA